MEASAVIEAFLRKQALVKKWVEGLLGYTLDNNDLWEQLKSGVDLCRLMLKIKEGSIPAINENPRLQFVKKENIVFFIEAAKEYGVPRYSLFDVPDLFEERDLQRVLDCLEAIAIKANHEGIEPKYEMEGDKAVRLPKLPQMANDMSKADRRATRLVQRGRALPSPLGPPLANPANPKAALAGHNSIIHTSNPSAQAPNHRLNLSPHSSVSHTSHSSSSSQMSNGNTLSNSTNSTPRTSGNLSTLDSPRSVAPLDLDSISNRSSGSNPRMPSVAASPRSKIALESSIVQLVSAARGRIARRQHQKRITDVAYRARVAQEIFATERVYVGHLTALVNVFCKPLMESAASAKPLLSLDEVKSIFSSIEVIKAYNQKLLEDLGPRVEAWSPTQRLGDIFLTICGFLKVYTNYIANYNTSISTLNRCRNKKEKFAQWLTEAEERPEVSGLKLGALLILPVQRIPRYQLLLADLTKHTWHSHGDYNDLVKATSDMAAVAQYLNEKKREADNISRVTEIQEQFTSGEDLALPHRRFVKEEVLKVLTGKDYKERKFYIFNDLLVVTKPHRGGMQFLSKSDKNKEKVISSHHIIDITLVPTSGFQFDIINEKNTVLYTIDAGSAANREEFLTLVKKQAADASQKHLPIHEDAKSPNTIRFSKDSSASNSISPPSSRPTSVNRDKDGDDPKKLKSRPSKSKEWLTTLKSNLADSHKKTDEDSSGTDASEESSASLPNDSVDSAVHEHNVVKPLLGLAPLSQSNQMPMSSLSPRNNQPDPQQKVDVNHDALAGALSPRLRPPVPPGPSNAPNDSISSAERRASFKRSMTERPAPPPKPGRLKLGAAGPQGSMHNLPKSKPPTAPPPSHPPPSQPLSSDSTHSSQSATEPPVPTIAAPEVESDEKRKPLRRSASINEAGEPVGTLRRSNAFKANQLPILGESSSESGSVETPKEPSNPESPVAANPSKTTSPPAANTDQNQTAVPRLNSRPSRLAPSPSVSTGKK